MADRNLEAAVRLQNRVLELARESDQYRIALEQILALAERGERDGRLNLIRVKAERALNGGEKDD